MVEMDRWFPHRDATTQLQAGPLAHQLRQLIDGIAPQCAPDGWVPPLSIPVFQLEALLVPFEPPRAVPYPEPPTDPMDDLDCEACQ